MVYPGTMHKLMLLSVTLLVGIACSDDSSSAAVPEASCCSSSKNYTSTECAEIGTAMGCETSRAVDSSCGSKGCEFENCDRKPSCN